MIYYSGTEQKLFLEGKRPEKEHGKYFKVLKKVKCYLDSLKTDDACLPQRKAKKEIFKNYLKKCPTGLPFCM